MAKLPPPKKTVKMPNIKTGSLITISKYKKGEAVLLVVLCRREFFSDGRGDDYWVDQLQCIEMFGVFGKGTTVSDKTSKVLNFYLDDCPMKGEGKPISVSDIKLQAQAELKAETVTTYTLGDFKSYVK